MYSPMVTVKIVLRIHSTRSRIHRAGDLRLNFVNILFKSINTSDIYRGINKTNVGIQSFFKVTSDLSSIRFVPCCQHVVKRFRITGHSLLLVHSVIVDWGLTRTCSKGKEWPGINNIGNARLPGNSMRSKPHALLCIFWRMLLIPCDTFWHDLPTCFRPYKNMPTNFYFRVFIEAA